MYLPGKLGGGGLKSLEEEYKLTKIKAAVNLYSNPDPVMQVHKRYEEKAEGSGLRALIEDATKYTQQLGLELNLSSHILLQKNETAEKWMERQLGDVIRNN